MIPATPRLSGFVHPSLSAAMTQIPLSPDEVPLTPDPGAAAPQPPSSGRGFRGSLTQSSLLLGFLLLLLIVLAYSNSLHGGWLYDDNGDILDNPSVYHLWPLRDVFTSYQHGQIGLHTRPVVMLSFALNYATGGFNPFHYHLTNLVIHCLAGLALFGLVKRTLSLPRFRAVCAGNEGLLALLVALLWSLHPLQTEAVSYVTQRYESSMGMFVLVCIYCVVRLEDSRHSVRWMVLGCLACALALGSKEVAVSLPILVLLFDRAFLSGTFFAAWRRHRPLYLGLVLAWAGFLFIQFNGVVRDNWAGFGISLPWWRYALSQPGVILHYLRLAFWPHPLCLDYAWPPVKSWIQVLPGLLCVGSLFAGTLYALVRRPGLGFLGAAFFLILAPTSSVMPILDLAVEHRMYLPLAPLIAVIVYGGYRIVSKCLNDHPLQYVRIRLAAAGVIAISLAALGVLTYLRNEDYSSPLDIWQDAVTIIPRNSRAHHNYAQALAEAGIFDLAISEYHKAIELAPASHLAYMNLGVLYGQMNRVPESLEYLRKAVEVEPRDWKNYINLGVTLLRKGSTDSAILCFRRGLELNPRSSEAYNNLGEAYSKNHAYDLANDSYHKAIAIKPGSSVYHWNLAVALLRQDKLGDSREELQTTLRLDPAPYDRNSQYGWILHLKGQDEEALPLLREALKGNPDHVPSLLRLAWILATSPVESIRNGKEALALAEKAKRLMGPLAPYDLNVLAAVYAEAGQYNAAQNLIQEAIDRTPSASEAAVLVFRERLKCYQSHLPFRDHKPMEL